MKRPEQLVRTFWDRIQARDWEGMRETLHNDVVVEWPASGERFVGADNFVSVNREYTEGWSIHVLGIVASGDSVVSEVEVPHEGIGVFRVASFWHVSDGRITRGTEYWIERGQDEAPAWRRQFTEAGPP